jgi:hypothetical protein
MAQRLRRTWMSGGALGILALVGLLNVAAAAASDGPPSGQAFRGWPQPWRALYVFGVTEGLSWGHSMRSVQGAPAAPNDRLRALVRCVEPMTAGQLEAIAGRFLDAHPERWHEPMSWLVLNALLDVCPAYQPSTP